MQRLAHNAVGACAQLQAKFRGLLCQQSFPEMRHLFEPLVLPTVSYVLEVWGPSCSPSVPPDIKKMADVQIDFFRPLCRLKKGVTPAVIFRELSERPVHRWSLASSIACPTCLTTGFMLRFSGITLLMPNNTLHVATVLVALSSSTAVLAWPRHFRLLTLHA